MDCDASTSYCGADGHCALLGECVAVCNAGSLGDGAGPFAGCHEPGTICMRHAQATQPSGAQLVYGSCVEP